MADHRVDLSDSSSEWVGLWQHEREDILLDILYLLPVRLPIDIFRVANLV